MVDSSGAASKMPFGSRRLLFGRRSRFMRFRRAELGPGLDVTGKVSALELHVRGRDCCADAGGCSPLLEGFKLSLTGDSGPGA